MIRWKMYISVHMLLIHLVHASPARCIILINPVFVHRSDRHSHAPPLPPPAGTMFSSAPPRVAISTARSSATPITGLTRARHDAVPPLGARIAHGAHDKVLQLDLLQPPELQYRGNEDHKYPY